VVAATANALTIMGFGQFVVANPREGDRTVFHATLFHLLIGCAVFVALWLLREPIASWLETPELPMLLPLVLLATVMDRLAYTPTRVLARDMRFRALVLRMLAGEIAYVAVSVGLAMKGLGAQAIVWGILARAVAGGLLIILAMNPRRWFGVGRLSWSTTRRMLRYGMPLGAANALHWISKRGDNLLIAGMFGPAAAGQYNLAYNLADIPATQIGEQVGDVLLPSFAKMETASARKRALVRAAGLLALLVFPAAVGLAALAPTLVRTIFDPRWWNIAPMLVVLSVLSVMRPLGWLVGAYLQAVHRTRTVMLLELLKTVGLLLSVIALGQLGLVWACGGVGVAFGIHALASMLTLKRDDGVPVRDLLVVLAPPLVAVLPMVICVMGTRQLFAAAELPLWSSLLAELAAGALTYAASGWLLASRQARDFVGLLAGALRRFAPASGSA
jgi:PST family polysaccharide transporter